MELYIPEERHTRNRVNGRFLKGHIPFNKGKKWSDYMDMRKAKRVKKYLELGRSGNPNIGGCNARKVVAVKNGRLMGVFASAMEVERKTGIRHENISKCCRGERKRAGGFQWFFENDDKWLDLI